MRCNPWRWLWGAIPLIVLACVAVLSDQQRLEADLEGRAKAALEKAGLAWATIRFRGREAVIVGSASDESDPYKAFDIVRGVWGVGMIDNRTQLVERVERYVWTATRFDDRVRFNGFVPNDGMRRALVGMAMPMFGNLKIEHEPLKIARGNPQIDQWMASVSFALKQLADLKSGGQVDLDGTSLTISGEAATPKSYDSIQSALKRLPSNTKLKSSNIRPPVVRPYTWEAKFDGGTIAMHGFAPSLASRDSLKAAAEKIDRKARVDLEVAAGSDPDFDAVANLAVRQLGQLEAGEAQVRDKRLTFSGMAVKEATAEAVRKALKQVPAQFKVEEKIEFREATRRPIVPYVTTITLTDGSIALSGHAPDETARTDLLATLKKQLPDRTVRGELGLGMGHTPAWAACLEIGIGSLARLGNGNVVLSDKRLTITGATASEELSTALPRSIKTQANRDCDATTNIAFNPPPEPHLTWRAGLESGTVTLTGAVPDDETKSVLAQSAQRLFAGQVVVDETRVVGGNGTRWRRVAEDALKMLARLRVGSALIEGDSLMLTGEARDTVAQAAIRDLLANSLPKGYQGRETLEVRADSALWAESEARKKAEADLRRTAEEEARKRAEAEALKKSDGEARLKAAAAEDAKRKSDAEAQAKADAAARTEVETRRKSEEQARLKVAAAEDAKRKSDAEAQAKADAAARTEAETRRKADVEARLKVAAAEDAKRKSDAEAQAKADAAARTEAETRRKADEQARLKAAAAEDAKRKSDADAQAKADAAARTEAETRRKADEQARLKAAAAEDAKRKSDADAQAKADAAARTEAETRRKADVEARKTVEPSPKAKAEANVCQTLLRSAAAKGAIRFQRASAVIERDSFTTLDALASIASKCPQALIQVEGHTDSDGTPERNQLLSERRAASVAEYLMRAGISQTRLTAVGVGEARPLAPNTTIENKARNRRIEFTVRAR